MGRRRHTRKVTEAYLRRWDGLDSAESGGGSNRPQRPLSPCPDIPDNLANIGSDRLSKLQKSLLCQGMENAETPGNIDLSAMSAMSGQKYSSGGRE